jgi:hypothetical protein
MCMCVYTCACACMAQLLYGGAGSHAVKVEASKRNFRVLELGDIPRLAAKLTSLCTAIGLPFHMTFWGSMSAGIYLNGECAHKLVI